MVWVWYPAEARSAPPAPYFPEPLLSADRRLFLSGPVTSLVIRDPALVRSHSLARPPVAGSAKYPVVLFRPGFGALTLQYATLAEDLASRGYFVVGIDAPYTAGVVAFADGRVITRSPKGSPPTSGPRSNFDRLVDIWAADSSFVLTRLTSLDRDESSAFHGKLDLAAVGALGHSFGGAASAEFCALDRRCKAAIDLDGLLFGKAVADGVPKPIMFLMTDHSGESGDPRGMADFHKVYEALPAGRLAVEVQGTRHFNVNDLAFERSPLFLSRAVGALGSMDRTRAINIFSDEIAAFFDVHLKGKSEAALHSATARYPEVRRLRF
jgi:predicted dienelactone hydrolase